MKTTIIDLTGQRFGRLTVIKRDGTIYGQASWLCICDCGKSVVVRGYCLRKGETRSCGCLAAELAQKRLITHGATKTRLFKIWSNMIARCYKPYHKSFKDYGGRGISICDEWLHSFAKFQGWAIANKYADNLSIDRINVNGNYEPSNCQWLTMKEQGQNRRTSRIITINNCSKTLSEWADKYGIIPETIARRIKAGWSEEKAITTPAIKNAVIGA